MVFWKQRGGASGGWNSAWECWQDRTELLVLLGCLGNCNMKYFWGLFHMLLAQKPSVLLLPVVCFLFFYVCFTNSHNPPLCVFVLQRYNELLFIIDTCQGASMYERFYSPNIMALASSQVGEDSLSVSSFPSSVMPNKLCVLRHQRAFHSNHEGRRDIWLSLLLHQYRESD